MGRDVDVVTFGYLFLRQYELDQVQAVGGRWLVCDNLDDVTHRAA
jgi:hypothetical protein